MLIQKAADAGVQGTAVLLAKTETRHACRVLCTVDIEIPPNPPSAHFGHSDRTYLVGSPRIQYDYLLPRRSVPIQQYLRHRVDLIIVGAVRESCALLVKSLTQAA